MGYEGPKLTKPTLSLMPAPKTPFEVEDFEALRNRFAEAGGVALHRDRERMFNQSEEATLEFLEFEKIHADRIKSAVFCDPNVRIETCPTNKPAKEGELSITNEQYFRAA